MSGGSSPGRIPSHSLFTDDFYPLPEYVASLVPPADELVCFDQFVAEHGVEDEKEEASCFAGPQEGSSGVDGRGDQGLGSSIEDGGEQKGAATSTTTAPKSWGASPATHTIWTVASAATSSKKGPRRRRRWCRIQEKIRQGDSGYDADDEDSIGYDGHGNSGQAAAVVGVENAEDLLVAPNEVLLATPSVRSKWRRTCSPASSTLQP